MFYQNIVFLTLLFLNSVESDILQKNNDYVAKKEQKTLDTKGRRDVAELYLKKLVEVKENWIDPYDMMGLAAQRITSSPEQKNEQLKHADRHSDVNVEPTKEPNNLSDEQTEMPQFSPPDLDIDEKPTFSDIRGDIIPEKKYIPDETALNIDTEPVKSFPSSQQICVLDSIYISRWLKKLVLKIEKESNLVPSVIKLPIDNVLLNNLKEFSAAKSLEISQLDELICNVIDHSSIVKIEDFDWTILSDYIKELVWPTIIFICGAVCAYAIFQGILHRPVFTTLCCIIVISVFWHWMHLYKQRQALKMAELSTMTIPAQCRKYEFGLFEHFHEYLRSFFTSNECAKYYEALTIDPFWEVSITVAISEAVTSMLFQPLSASSRYLNLAIKQLFEGLTIFTVIPLLIFLFLILIMLCNYRIRFPLFMGALEPNIPSVGSRVQEVKSSKALKSLKDTVKCKLPSRGERACMPKSLACSMDVHMGTRDVSKKWRSEKGSIQNLPEDQFICSGVKDSSPQDQLNMSPSKNSIELSTSEDDISVIDSDENNTDTENSFMEHTLPGCQQNCQCLFPAEYLSNTGCKDCDDNLKKQNMNDSFHFSPEGCDRKRI